MTELDIIRNSDTFFSTMKCPKCGEYLQFSTTVSLFPRRPHLIGDCQCGHSFRHFDMSEICLILNNNGLDYLVQEENESKNEEHESVDN